AATGTTVFVSSHILSEVQQLVDVVGIIAHGKLVREGPIRELLAAEGAGPVPTAGEGWLTVSIDPARGAEVNRALVERGIYASRLEAGTTLATLFLDLTAEPSAPTSQAPGAPPPVTWANDPGARPKDEPTGWGGR